MTTNSIGSIDSTDSITNSTGSSTGSIDSTDLTDLTNLTDLINLADATVGINASLVLEANVISLVLISSERTNAGAKLN